MTTQPLLNKFILVNTPTVFAAWITFPVFGWKVAVVCTSLVMVLSSWLCVRYIKKPFEFWSKQLKGIKNGSYSDRFRFFASDVKEFKQLGDLLANASQILRDNFKASIRATREEDAILKSMSDGVLVLDKEERIVVCNDVAKKILGLSEDNIEGRLLFEKIRSLELQEFVHNQVKSSISGEFFFEFSGLEGENRSLIAKSAPLIGRSQRVKGVVLILVDITRIKMLEKYRKQFVTNVSHEMKTPLTAIQGYSEVLKNQGLSSEKVKEYATIVEEQALRLNGIVDALLLLSSIDHKKGNEEEGNLEKIDIVAALSRTLNHQKVLFEGLGVNFKFSSPDALMAYADPQLLDIAISNLISNAAKYSAQEDGTTGEVHIELLAKTGEVVIRVLDNGPGIESQYHSRIFERFFRLDKGRDRKLGGSGLGLSLVKNIAKFHGGSVEVSSNRPQGSVFTYKWPLKR